MANHKKIGLIIGGILLLLLPIAGGIWYLTRKPSSTSGGSSRPSADPAQDKKNKDVARSEKG